MYLKKKRKKLDFNIKNIMVTKKQKLAISFCEEILDIQFEGNINNFNDVNNFLSLNLENAKMIAEDAKESYYSEFMY